MKTFKNILLVYPCDRSTLARAVSLAKHNRSRLTVMQVVKELPPQVRHMDLGGSPVDLQALAIQEYQSQLRDLIAPIKQEGVKITLKVLAGVDFLELIRDVIAHQRDLVMMTAEGGLGLTERLFGSTSYHLMRKCPCPVWIMKPTRRKRFARVLAAVDPDPSDAIRDSLNVTILRHAAALAAQDNAELHVIHAWNWPYLSLMRGLGGASEAEVQQHVEAELQRQRGALDSLVAKHTDAIATVHLVKGEPGAVVPEMTQTSGIGLLVMGTVCRTGIPGFFIGNTAETILDQVDCSVLTVKPDGFVSPVELA